MPLARPHRLVVLGSTRVGKTALIEQLIFGNHVVGLGGPETLGDVYEVLLETDGHGLEQVQIYDTPGNLFSVEGLKEALSSEQEHFISIADGFMLVYDITSRASFELVTGIRQKIHFTLKHKECPIVVVGNKFDLNGIRDVDANQVQLWAHPQTIHTFETSVLDRDSLREPFTYIAWSMANPGRLAPAHFVSSSVIVQNSLSIPQQRHRQQHSQPLLEKSPSPPFSLVASPATHISGSISSSSSPWDGPQRQRSTSSDALSEHSLGSRISSRHLYPDDATFGKGGLLGLADCMSSKQKSMS